LSGFVIGLAWSWSRRIMHHLGFRDRRGDVHLPLDGMVRLAQSFAAAEPRTVNEYIDDREEELRLRGNVPGDRWWHDYLREHAPGYALARRWAGIDQEADGLRREIARLRSLASGAAYDRRSAGRERKASRLLRALDGL
jgi:hypothetical protein